MLSIENLFFEYVRGVPVLQDVSFRVTPGHLCGLFGPNGCGKSTLFKCCLKFLKVESGTILMDGVNVRGTAVPEMAKLVSYVPQEHKPPFPYQVKEVVLMGRTPHLGGTFGIPPEEKKKAYEAMDVLGITSLADAPYNQLSVGQRQLVIIARAVAQDTQLLLLDEPTSALDFRNQVKIWQILRKIAENGTTVVACTHDPNHVMWFCDEVVVMGDGRVITQGAPKKALSEDTLNKIYKDTCRVTPVGKTHMIYPNVIDEGKKGE